MIMSEAMEPNAVCDTRIYQEEKTVPVVVRVNGTNPVMIFEMNPEASTSEELEFCLTFGGCQTIAHAKKLHELAGEFLAAAVDMEGEESWDEE